MLITFIAGLIVGYIVSIPPLGPISFALISKGFKNEVKKGMTIAAGAAFMDFVYAMIAFEGISLIISLLPDSVGKFYSENNGTIQIILTYAGCLVVIIYGLKISKTKISVSELETKQSVKVHHFEEKALELEGKAIEFAKHYHVPVEDKTNLGALFLMGVMLCFSSITLPASWIALVGYMKSYGVIGSSLLIGIIFSAGAFFGTAIWFYTLLKLITGNKHRINYSTVSKLNIIAGVILIFLGIFLFLKATISIFNLL